MITWKSVKPCFDLVTLAVLLPLCLPLLAAVACAVRWKLGTPVIFVQLRPGLHARPFRLLKFRTMTEAKDAVGALLPDGERLTRFGRFLRKTSLDELPEVINVLRGEMSLVGPRPLLMQYLPLYTPDQARRHEVRPGITGLAQVSGRNGLSWEERFGLDVWYVDNMSLALDVKILFITVLKVFRSEGISQEGQATMEAFRGSGRQSTEKR